MKLRQHVLTPTGAIQAWASMLLVIAGLGLALGWTIGYVAHTRAVEQRQWCDLLGVLIQPQPTSPPQTPQEVHSRAVTEQIRRLHHSFGCDRR